MLRPLRGGTHDAAPGLARSTLSPHVASGFGQYAVGTRAQAPEVALVPELPHDAVSEDIIEDIVNAVAHREGTSNAGVPAERFRELTDMGSDATSCDHLIQPDTPVAQLWCRGDGPQTEQWIVSPTGRSWRVMLGASA